MNSFLAITGSFIDRMTNPLFGPDINEEYLLRFNQLLTDDPRLADQLGNLALEPEDIGSLPMCAWPWYLQWRSERADPPSQGFLDALFDATDDPAVHMAIVMSALSDQPDEDLPDDAEPGELTAAAVPIQSRWLRGRLARLNFEAERERSLGGAIEIGAQLLQIGDAESLASLRELLSIPWVGQNDLRASVARQLLDADLDPQTMTEWYELLRLPGQAFPGELA